MEKGKEKGKKEIGRRDWLKGLATVPVLGAFAYAAYRKMRYDRLIKSRIFDEIQMSQDPVELPPAKLEGKQIRLGIIGNGGRGKDLVKAAGFIHPTQIEDWQVAAEANPSDSRYSDFIAQDDLNVVITAVCDIFETNAQWGLEAGANINREGTGGVMGSPPKMYSTYKELIAADDVDAIIIGTPDHWHAPMTLEAARHGKHVYCEKPMTWTVPETYEVLEAVKSNDIVFQLGHQGRQTESYIKAQEAIDKNLLGPISLIEVNTNRNDPNGAWVYDIHPDANPGTIDWEQFIGPAPWHDFSLERFFRWRCWWDYSTGLSGDLLTHEFDAINQILRLGIPHSAMSTGGIYYFKDGRTVPDVLHTVFEYPERDLSLVYSATLASNKERPKLLMGHDGHMELGSSVMVYADRGSTRYKEKIEAGIIDPSLPLYAYTPGKKKVDAITSATEQYFAGRGLLYTYRGGKRVDTTHLHIREWIEAIRNGTQPSCDVEEGFVEAIAAHMGTISYKEGRKVFWDPDKMEIV